MYSWSLLCIYPCKRFRGIQHNWEDTDGKLYKAGYYSACGRKRRTVIRLQFTDVSGNLKNVAITASQLERALDNKCMFDGSAIEGFVRIEESDMYLYPDLNTFEILPWRPQHGKVARFMCETVQR